MTKATTANDDADALFELAPAPAVDLAAKPRKPLTARDVKLWIKLLRDRGELTGPLPPGCKKYGLAQLRPLAASGHEVAQALLARNGKIIDKLKAVRQRLYDGAVFDSFKSEELHSRRFGTGSGDYDKEGGIQRHNYSRSPKGAWPLVAADAHQYSVADIEQGLRSIIRAKGRRSRDGKHIEQLMIVGDFAQIEMRLALYQAGLIDKVDDNNYEVAGGRAFGVDPAEVKNPSVERTVGKVMCLGLNYEMGQPAFYAYCLKNGLEITEERANEIYDIYREQVFPEIFDYSSRLLTAWKRGRSPTNSLPLGMRVGLFHEGNDTTRFFVLASGFAVVYHRSEVGLERLDGKPGTFAIYNPPPRAPLLTLKDKWEAKVKSKLGIHRGKMMADCTQSLAADVLRDAMLRLEQRLLAEGWSPEQASIRFHVHDEIGVIADADIADRVKGVMEEEMALAPAWLPGIILRAEVGIGPNWMEAGK